MSGSEWLAVHGMSQQHIIQCFLHRQTAREINLARGARWLGDGAVIGAFENNFTRLIRNPGALQHVAQSNAGPFRVADSTQLPLHTFNFRNNKDAAITGAFQRDRDRLRGHLA